LTNHCLEVHRSPLDALTISEQLYKHQVFAYTKQPVFPLEDPLPDELIPVLHDKLY